MSKGKSRDCLSCKISGSASFFLMAAYFHYTCKFVKPVYYVGITSTLYLGIARALALPPFNE